MNTIGGTAIELYILYGKVIHKLVSTKPTSGSADCHIAQFGAISCTRTGSSSHVGECSTAGRLNDSGTYSGTIDIQFLVHGDRSVVRTSCHHNGIPGSCSSDSGLNSREGRRHSAGVAVIT